MAKKILGPTGSTRRRRWLGVPTLLVMLVALFWIAGAQAVHDEGLIQLDGDALTSTVPSYGGADDWDLICKAHLTTNNPAGECEASSGFAFPAGSSSADESQFVGDAFGAATDDIFTTGGSKDDLDIPSWKFKNATPSPDKADLEHAMAAIYSKTNPDEKFVYFAADRFANNGDVNIAFWFFQSQVKENGDGGLTPSNPPDTTLCSVSSGCGFSGTHTAHGAGPDGYICYPGMAGYNAIETQANMTDTPCLAGSGGPGDDDTRGDILIVSAFTVGGAQPNIQVYEWVGINNAPNLPAQNGLPKKDLKVTAGRSVVSVPTGASLAAGCATNPLNNDPACAIVNSAALTSHPWTFTDKGTGGSNPQQGEFYEGGLNLTALGFGDTCFSTFLVNTRSSQSVDASLQDFALGQLGSCSTTLTTAASLNASGTTIDNSNTAANGTASSGTDTATLTINGVSAWNGNLSWYICGPLAAGAVCSNNGVLVTSRNNVNNASPASDFVSGSATLTSAGRYCWYSKFTPDAATAAKGVLSDDDDGSGTNPNPECFTVSPVTPTLDTQAGSSPVDLGQAVTDTATLSGVAKEPGSNGSNTTYPTIGATNGAFVGTIGFTLKGPDGANPSTVPADCSSTNATAFAGETQTFPITLPTTPPITGNGSYGPVSFKPGAPGAYHWVAVYSASATTNNTGLPVTHNANCSDGDEAVTVRQIPTNIKTKQSWYPNDTATITSSLAGDNLKAGGTIDWFLYDNATCTGTAKYSERYTILAADEANSIEKGTHNYPGSTATTPSGGTVTPYNITTGYADAANSTVGQHAWKVVYTPTDSAHTGKQSACNVEHFNTTYTNDNGPGTNLP